LDSFVWTVTNLIAAFILPPGIFFVLIALALWCGRARRWMQWLAGCALVLFMAMTLGVVGYGLSSLFESRWPPLEQARAKQLRADDAFIVVLGGGRTLGAIEYPEAETLSSASMRRSLYAARLAGATGLKIAVSGGKPAGGAVSEAGLMRDFIEKDLRQPVALVEDQSFDTRQNALYVAKSLDARKIRTVVLVTDVVHMPRSVHFRASAPLNITDFLPSVDGLEMTRYAVREMVGALWYRLRRAIG
jgi:uncharacterized SAM-binding protein YcdF (DUF218 family)